jgi:hypothetical protein
MPVVEDGGSNPNQQQQYNGLGFIQIVSFTATPSAVTPFAEVTLSWKVTVPTTLNVPVHFVVNGQTFTGTSGSVTAQIVDTTEFGLLAKTALASRVIGAVTVTSDTSACTGLAVPANTVESFAVLEVTKSFPASSQFSFRGNGPTAKVGSNTVSVAIPLNINVPDWFDAQADIAVVLNVQGSGPITGRAVAISLPSVNTNVSWNLASQILSLGCEHFIENAMQTLATAFLTQIINAQIIQPFKDDLNKLIDLSRTVAESGDSQHRTFVLTSVAMSTSGLSYTLCPRPNPVFPPGHLPPKAVLP